MSATHDIEHDEKLNELKQAFDAQTPEEGGETMTPEEIPPGGEEVLLEIDIPLPEEGQPFDMAGMKVTPVSEELKGMGDQMFTGADGNPGSSADELTSMLMDDHGSPSVDLTPFGQAFTVWLASNTLKYGIRRVEQITGIRRKRLQKIADCEVEPTVEEMDKILSVVELVKTTRAKMKARKK